VSVFFRRDNYFVMGGDSGLETSGLAMGIADIALRYMDTIVPKSATSGWHL
jgi:hypothetical protein